MVCPRQVAQGNRVRGCGAGVGQWTLYGPDQQILWRADVCNLLRISEATLDRLVREGRFPRGIKASAGAEPFWTGLDIAAYLHLAPRMEEPEKVPERGGEKKS